MDLLLIKELHEKMNNHQFVVSYMGNFNQDLLKALINITEKKLLTLEADKTIKKRIFHFMIECVQNICRNEGVEDQKFLFLIGKRDDDYMIYTGGVFAQQETKTILKHIEQVNAMEHAEVKEAFYTQLAQELSKESMLLLSLLDISKRTKTKIDCETKPIGRSMHFLSFKTVITHEKQIAHGNA